MKSINENPSKSECIHYITNQSEKLHIPTRLALATAWIESCFTQFKSDGTVLCNPSGNDFGLMQINLGHKEGITLWGRLTEDDWQKVLTDWKFNTMVGLTELQNCYLLASSEQELNKGLMHFKELTAEQCSARAAYSAYNAGPHNMNRYRTPQNTSSYGYDLRDINFWYIYTLQTWNY